MVSRLAVFRSVVLHEPVVPHVEVVGLGLGQDQEVCRLLHVVRRLRRVELLHVGLVQVVDRIGLLAALT